MKPVPVLLELSGHIIDSLTLAKVIDKIQSFGLDYQLNDLRIGRRKHDISFAQLSLWADDERDLQQALDELAAHGALPVRSTPVRTAPCTEDGVLPAGGYSRGNPPIEVLLDGQWVPVERQGTATTVVVEGGAARLVRIRELRRGDCVVVGNDGLRVVPEE